MAVTASMLKTNTLLKTSQVSGLRYSINFDIATLPIGLFALINPENLG
jgi:hypothetical protein